MSKPFWFGVTLSCATFNLAAYQWSDQFFGGNNQTILEFNGNLSGFVAAKAGSVPIEYINANGELECHILLKNQGNSWRSLGDIGSINGGSNCPLISGVTPVRAVTAFGPDVCIGGDFTNLGGVNGLSHFACYSESLGWYQPNGIGNGPNLPVYALDTDGLNVYVGGQFTFVNAGTLSAKRIVKTDGLNWTPLYTDAQETDNGVGGAVSSVLSTTSFLAVVTGNTLQTWNSAVPEWVSRGGHNGSAVGQPDIVNFASEFTMSSKNATAVAGDPGGSVSSYDVGGDEWRDHGNSQGIDTQFAQLAFGLGPLYSTGDFTSIDMDARGLAWFNGVTWEAAPMAEQLGNLNTSQVTDMQQGDARFCLRTQSNPADAQKYWNNLVCYDNSQWIGDNRAPLSNVVQTLGEYAGEVIHGGDFMVIGDQKSPHIGRLNGTNHWEGISQLSWGGAGTGHVRHLQEHNGLLYATGLFNDANGTAVNGVARWNGSSWSQVTADLNAFDGSMTTWNNLLIIQGTHNALGPILSWNGSQIAEVGTFNFSGTITDMIEYQGDLVVSVIASGIGRLYRYNSSSWSAFGGTMSGNPLTLAVDGDDLYVGGTFTGACNGVDFVAANHIYRWDGLGCNALGSGVDNSGPIKSINAMVHNHGQLFVTGRFETAGGQTANSIAAWNGNAWVTFGNGLVDGMAEGQGNTLWVKEDILYVAGFFEQAGDKLSHHFAALDLDGVFSNGFD